MAGLNGCFNVDCEGVGKEISGGLVMLRRSHVELECKSCSQNHITFKIKGNVLEDSFTTIVIYGYPEM